MNSIITQRLLIVGFALCFLGCKPDFKLQTIEGKRIEINDSLASDPAIDTFLQPYIDHVNADLDSVLSYAKATYSKSDGELNTAIGNMMADAVLEMSDPVFYERTGKHIDVVLLNHGGIRSIISEGPITTRTAYEVMPFENAVVVVAMSGELIQDLIAYLIRANRAHPIAGLKLHLNGDGEVVEALIGNRAIAPETTYYVATNDYLYNGGDRMSFLRAGDSLFTLDYKIRNVLIDYFKQYDTIDAVRDDRFIKTNQ